MWLFYSIFCIKEWIKTKKHIIQDDVAAGIRKENENSLLKKQKTDSYKSKSKKTIEISDDEESLEGYLKIDILKKINYKYVFYNR